MTIRRRLSHLFGRLADLEDRTVVEVGDVPPDPELQALVDHAHRELNIREGLPEDAPRPRREMSRREVAELCGQARANRKILDGGGRPGDEGWTW
jgi:hypothetical protein